MKLSGRAWVFGDQVSVEHFVPARYDELMYTGQVDELASHLFEDLPASEQPTIEAGDVIVAGHGFGIGKHHDGLVLAMRHIGLAGYLADSFHPLFARTCIDLGIPACVVPGISDRVATGDMIEWALDQPTLTNATRGETVQVDPVPAIVLDILRAGGWSPYVRDLIHPSLAN